MSSKQPKTVIAGKEHAAYSHNYRLLHWSMAGIIVTLLLAGQQFNFNLSDAYRITGLQAHSTLGLSSLLIVVLLIFKRFIRCDPVPKTKLPLLQMLAARSVQYGLYILAILFPLSGLAASLYSPHPVYFLGIFDLAIMDVRQEINFSYFRSIHMWATRAAMLLLASHAGAALYHHFVVKDNVLKTMVGFNSHSTRIWRKISRMDK